MELQWETIAVLLYPSRTPDNGSSEKGLYMAGNPTAKKRQREVARQEHQREKAAKKQQRKSEKEPRGPLEPGEDPDLAGIIPGPQPKEEEEELL